MAAPRLRALTPEEAPEAARPVFERFLAERGNIPNLFRTLARRPEIMVAYAQLLKEVTYSGSVDVRTKELAMLRVSQVNGSAYWQASHTALLKRAGGDDALIADMHLWSLSERFDERDRAVLELAETMTLRAGPIPDPLWEQLIRHFDEGQIIELVACIGAFNAFNRMANALQVEITR